MLFGDLTYEEIRVEAQAGSLAVVPTGCTEQQGFHLPVDFDSWFAETLCAAGAERAEAVHGVRALVLPAMPFGPTPEQRNFGSGYIDVPHELHVAVMSSVLESLAAQGFRRTVVWRGCGQHRLHDLVERFNASHVGQARAFLPAHPYHDIWCRLGDPQVPGGHADSFTTSISLHLRPGTVRTDRIVNPNHPPVRWDDPNLDFAAYSSTGVIGDPTHASAELGAKLWEAVVEHVASVLNEIAHTPTDG
jgi:creatinine amidohydrolase